MHLNLRLHQKSSERSRRRRTVLDVIELRVLTEYSSATAFLCRPPLRRVGMKRRTEHKSTTASCVRCWCVRSSKFRRASMAAPQSRISSFRHHVAADDIRERTNERTVGWMASHLYCIGRAYGLTLQPDALLSRSVRGPIAPTTPDSRCQSATGARSEGRRHTRRTSSDWRRIVENCLWPSRRLSDSFSSASGQRATAEGFVDVVVVRPTVCREGGRGIDNRGSRLYRSLLGRPLNCKMVDNWILYIPSDITRCSVARGSTELVYRGSTAAAIRSRRWRKTQSFDASRWRW